MPDYSFNFAEYENSNQLSSIQKLLIIEAKKSCASAYAPYSGFKVGCAVLLSNNEIITGANIENASYPVGICAERTALSYAMTKYPEEEIIAIAISYHSKKDNSEIISPCGMCRQFIIECQSNNKNPIELILNAPNNKVIIINDANHLLPFSFTSKML